MTARRRDRFRAARQVGAASALASALAGCGGDVQDTTGVPGAVLAVPPRAGFEVVADAMQLHCGTLDCHGQTGRNMRLYGQYGLRLAPTDNPLDQSTSNAEYDACYASIVGLEPEAMSDVVLHRAQPDALAMFRKPRGIEKHKGGQLVIQGDALDRCMVTWVTGTVDSDACFAAQMGRPRVTGGN